MGELTALKGVVISAEMDVVLPDGKQVLLPMNDAGVSGDLMANDGAFAAVLEATEVGTYVVTCTIKGKTAEGAEFIRNTLESFSVISPDFVLTGTQHPLPSFSCCVTFPLLGLASAEYPADREVLQFYIDVDSLTTITGGTVKAYAEVWGTDETGFGYVPVAWIQAMVDVERTCLYSSSSLTHTHSVSPSYREGSSHCVGYGVEQELDPARQGHRAIQTPQRRDPGA